MGLEFRPGEQQELDEQAGTLGIRKIGRFVAGVRVRSVCMFQLVLTN